MFGAKPATCHTGRLTHIIKPSLFYSSFTASRYFFLFLSTNKYHRLSCNLELVCTFTYIYIWHFQRLGFWLSFFPRYINIVTIHSFLFIAQPHLTKLLPCWIIILCCLLGFSLLSFYFVIPTSQHVLSTLFLSWWNYNANSFQLLLVLSWSYNTWIIVSKRHYKRPYSCLPFNTPS